MKKILLSFFKNSNKINQVSLYNKQTKEIKFTKAETVDIEDLEVKGSQRTSNPSSYSNYTTSNSVLNHDSLNTKSCLNNVNNTINLSVIEAFALYDFTNNQLYYYKKGFLELTIQEIQAYNFINEETKLIFDCLNYYENQRMQLKLQNPVFIDAMKSKSRGGLRQFSDLELNYMIETKIKKSKIELNRGFTEIVIYDYTQYLRTKGNSENEGII